MIMRMSLMMVVILAQRDDLDQAETGPFDGYDHDEDDNVNGPKGLCLMMMKTTLVMVLIMMILSIW